MPSDHVIDISAEWSRIVTSDESSAMRQRLKGQGVTFQKALAVGGIGATQGQALDGRWHPRSGGGDLVILGVYDTDPPSIYRDVSEPVLADLLAWRPDDPTRWWLRAGDAPAFLGIAEAEIRWALRQPLKLFQTPLDWCRAASNGAVVLDWHRAMPLLRTLDSIVCRDLDFAERLDARLRAPDPRLPKIMVPERAVAA